MGSAWFWITAGFLSFVITIGNGIVIWLITVRPRLRKTENWFILSLALVDFSVGFFVVPSHIVCEFLIDNCIWQVQVLFYELLLFVSVGNLFSMTLDRYIAVTRPLLYHSIMKTSRVQVFISLAWCGPAFISLLPLTWRFGETSANNSTRDTVERTYRAFVIVVFVFLPIASLLAVYMRICLLVRKLSRQVNMQRLQLRFNGGAPTNTKFEKPTSRVLGAVIIIFVCCWVLSSYRSICTFFNLCQVSPEIERVSRLLFFWNSAANPFVYSFLKKDIRREMKRFFRREHSVDQTHNEMQERLSLK